MLPRNLLGQSSDDR